MNSGRSQGGTGRAYACDSHICRTKPSRVKVLENNIVAAILQKQVGEALTAR